MVFKTIMINTILGSKGKMDQIFVEGIRYPVTRVKAGPCVVTFIKTTEKDGYQAVQLGFGEKRLKNTSKPVQGHLKNFIKDNKAPRYVREVEIDTEDQVKVGDKVKASDIFLAGDKIEVAGVSKGKGFAGAVKRWGFAGGPKTHGQSDRQRAPGSIGQGTTPGRVLKGKHMAGRMGNETTTVKNLKIMGVDPETNEILISGPIPGTIGSLIFVKRLNTREENPAPEVEVKEEVEEVVETPAEEAKVEEAVAAEPEAEAVEETKEESNA